ncbi:MAG: hypothetical protein AAFX50_18905 [Acidobacteriota bacterium]
MGARSPGTGVLFIRKERIAETLPLFTPWVDPRSGPHPRLTEDPRKRL